jgi:hypothetical protein
MRWSIKIDVIDLYTPPHLENLAFSNLTASHQRLYDTRQQDQTREKRI